MRDFSGSSGSPPSWKAICRCSTLTTVVHKGITISTGQTAIQWICVEKTDDALRWVECWTIAIGLSTLWTTGAVNILARGSFIPWYHLTLYSQGKTLVAPIYPGFDSSPGWACFWFSNCYEGFSLGPLVLLLPEKPASLNSNSIRIEDLMKAS